MSTQKIFFISFLAIFFPAVSFASLSINYSAGTISASALTGYGGTNSYFLFDGAGNKIGTYLNKTGLAVPSEWAGLAPGSYTIGIESGGCGGSCNFGVSPYGVCGSASGSTSTCGAYMGTFPVSETYFETGNFSIASAPITPFLTVPSSTGQATLGNISTQIGDLGFLKLMVIAMAIPLVFALADSIIKLNDYQRKHPNSKISFWS